MKLAIASDLHLEYADLVIENTENADVLVLAGDIMVAIDLHKHPEPEVPYPEAILKTLGRRQACAVAYRAFLKRASENFPQVVYVAGNHEFYHGKWVQTLETLRGECSKYGNVHFLENDIVDLEEYTFIGATLWTDLNKGDPLTHHAIRDMMSDYKFIVNDDAGYTKLRPAHTMSRHRYSLSYFKTVIDARKDRKFIVVSHMAPSSLSIHDNYRNDTLMNGAYFSDLSEFILDRPQITHWLHGHMHHDNDYTIGDCRVLSNPRGYVGYERMTQEDEPYFPLILEV